MHSSVYVNHIVIDEQPANLMATGRLRCCNVILLKNLFHKLEVTAIFAGTLLWEDEKLTVNVNIFANSM